MSTSAEPAGALFAVPFLPDPLKLAYLLDRLCEHRPWFSDFLWEDPKVRRESATLRLSEAYATGLVWEVYRGPAIVGVLMLDSIVERTDALCHFVFFDRTLSDKLELCRDLMGQVFETLQLNCLRVEVPLHVRTLVKFARKLGFLYEAERLPNFDVRLAAIGSRKHAAMMYEGSWVDSLLLSITAEEFQRGRTKHEEGKRECCEHASIDGPSTGVAAELYVERAEPVSPAS